MAEAKFEIIAGEEVMSAREVAGYLNKSRAYIYAIAKKDPSFPRGFSLTPQGRRLWKRIDIDGWLRSKMQGD